MDCTCRTHGDKKLVQNLVGKREGKRLLGVSMRGWENKLGSDRNRMRRCELDSSGSRQGIFELYIRMFLTS